MLLDIHETLKGLDVCTLKGFKRPTMGKIKTNSPPPAKKYLWAKWVETETTTTFSGSFSREIARKTRKGWKVIFLVTLLIKRDSQGPPPRVLEAPLSMHCGRLAYALRLRRWNEWRLCFHSIWIMAKSRNGHLPSSDHTVAVRFQYVHSFSPLSVRPQFQSAPHAPRKQHVR